MSRWIIECLKMATSCIDGGMGPDQGSVTDHDKDRKASHIGIGKVLVSWYDSRPSTIASDRHGSIW